MLILLLTLPSILLILLLAERVGLLVAALEEYRGFGAFT